MHSYILVDKNELYHYKYTKREPDGKGGWRYYYGPPTSRPKVPKVVDVKKRGEPIKTNRPVSGVNLSGRPVSNPYGNNTVVTSKRQSSYFGKDVNPAVRQDKITSLSYQYAQAKKDLDVYNQLSGLSPAGIAAKERARANVEATGRNLAAFKQQEDRIQKEEIKPINKIKATVKSISMAVGSAYDTGKNWLSNLFKK